MKNLVLLFTLILTSIGWSQYNIESVTRTDDVFCSGDVETYIIRVSHPGFAAPTIVMNSTSNDATLQLLYNNPQNLTDTVIFYVDVFDQGNVTVNGQQNDTLFFSFVEAGTPDTSIATLSYGDIIPNVDLSSVNLCSNGLPFDLNDYATPSGGDYLDVNSVPISNVFNPKEFFNEFGTSGTISYNYTNTAGCFGGNEITVTINISPTATVSTSPSSCGNADGDATVIITPGTVSGPMSVYWSTGFLDASVSSTSTISNLSSGVYYANVTDNFGCKAVGTAQVSDVDLVVTSNIVTETCTGMNDGLIDLTITGGGTVTQTFWSNGVTTEDMTGYPGEYSVEIHTDNNCNAFGTYILPGNNMSFSTVSVTPYDCSTAGGAFIDIDTSSTAGISALSWTNDIGSELSTMADWSPPSAGVYTCTLTDNNGCTKSWDLTVPSVSNAGMFVQSVTKENCGLTNGAVDLAVSFGTITSMLWSNGATTEDLTNVAAGDYTLQYKDNNGCSNFLTVTVPNVLPFQPQICLLTVDTSLVYNKIIWQKDPNNVVDGFKIYRETTNYGEFELIATVPYSTNSEFIDNEASPKDRSWRYFITSFDGCNESYGSFIHKTIHVVIEFTDLVTYNLAWDDYEGISYSSVDLWRYDATNGWEIAASNLGVGTNTYQDTPTDITDLNYMVAFNLSTPCTVTKAINHDSSRSNSTSSIFAPGGDTDLSVIENQDGKIMMYPNPTTDNLNISIENPDKFKTLRIINMNGELVFEQNITQSLFQISTADLPQGIYFVQIYSENTVVIEKIIKQ